jgi:methylmalonyl-CoA mutase cobalamin-binding subunit
MMKTLRVLDSSGDTELHFDETEATANARAEAEALFTRLRAEGATALAVTPGGEVPAQRVEKFSELGEETIIVPRIVGG